MGTSLGANAALEVAAAAPERLRGMVIEMPVLDNGAARASALAFTPLLVALTFGEPVMKLVARGTRAVPRRLLPHYGNVMLDLVRQEPGPGGALLQGLFFGRIAPHAQRARTFTTPDARARPPARPCPSLLRRGHARQGDARTRACSRPTRWWSCACARAADRRDRRLPRRGLGSGAGARAKAQPRPPRGLRTAAAPAERSTPPARRGAAALSASAGTVRLR